MKYDNLEKKTKKELADICKELGINVNSKTKKSEMIEKIELVQMEIKKPIIEPIEFKPEDTQPEIDIPLYVYFGVFLFVITVICMLFCL